MDVLVKGGNVFADYSDVLEFVVTHSFKGMKAIDRDGYSFERFREVLTPACSQFTEGIKPKLKVGTPSQSISQCA